MSSPCFSVIELEKITNKFVVLVLSQHLKTGVHLLDKLAKREKLTCLIVSLGSQGYSLMLRGENGAGKSCFSKQKITLNHFYLAKNEQDTSHKLYM